MEVVLTAARLLELLLTMLMRLVVRNPQLSLATRGEDWASQGQTNAHAFTVRHTRAHTTISPPPGKGVLLSPVHTHPHSRAHTLRSH